MKVIEFILFNNFIKTLINFQVRVSFIYNLNKRIKAYALEIMYSTAVLIPFFTGIIIENLFLSDSFLTYSCIFIMITIFNKDFFNGQSVMNRELGYQVVNSKTLKPASKLRCLIRNITFHLALVEVLFSLLNEERRLGDFIAGTRLINIPPSKPETILIEMKEIKIDKDAIFTLIISFTPLAAYIFY
jgi:hypothetical protein